jgi:hypothetical protein
MKSEARRLKAGRHRRARRRRALMATEADLPVRSYAPIGLVWRPCGFCEKGHGVSRRCALCEHPGAVGDTCRRLARALTSILKGDARWA